MFENKQHFTVFFLSFTEILEYEQFSVSFET